MKTSIRSRRLRNIHQPEEKQQEPFFSQSSEHERRPFFNTRQGGSVQPVQAKLKVGKPGDRYEQEADRVATNVVARNGGSPEVQRQEPGSIQRVTLMTPAEDEKLGTAEARMEKDKLIQEKIQRKGGQQEDEPLQMMETEEEGVQAKEEEEPLQRMGMEEEDVQAKEEEVPLQRKELEEEKVQAKGDEEGGNVASPGVNQQIEKSASGGRPLPGEIRAEMERAFGVDFSGVNIHTDAEAVRVNRQLRSQAFTRGQDIFFNEGQYRPETSAGRLLLAHELAHVVQQCGRKPVGERKT
ncbi:MAG: DUF4157 domain-containing protein [Nitrospira sp. CR2.1]|nr:DUF4157 domain-containing protein [Nitrospira sp. CR2.1]